MRLALATAPATDAVALAEVRNWLNFVEGIVEDDETLEMLIDEVYDYLENRTNRKFLTQTWTVTLDECEVGDCIRFPLIPLVSVSSIVTTDDDGTDTTVTATNYQVIPGENPRIVLTEDGEWPDDMRDYDSMAITAVAGYNGDDALYVGFVPSTVTAPGLDDMAASGTFTGTVKTTFEVVIATSDDTDTFNWRKVTRDENGTKTYGSWTSGVAITGAAQLLADGVSIKFTATTGHTAGDKWTVQAYEVLPRRVKMLLKGLVLHFYATKGRGVTETVSGQLIGTPRILEYMIESLRVVPL